MKYEEIEYTEEQEDMESITDENARIFKSYLRQLLRRLKDLQDAHNKGDSEKAAQIISELIKDTQRGIEE